MEIPSPDMQPGYLDCFRVREYHVDLNLEDLHSFCGRVRIFAEILGPPRNVFFLHSAGLKISHATVGGVTAVVSDELSVTRATRFELLVTITGSVVMEVNFSGLISKRAPEGLSMLGPGMERRRRIMQGRGKARKNAGDGSQSQQSSFPLGTVLGTHLEPTHARDLFPCLDIPSCKAVFHLTLRGVPAHLKAVSNARILRVEEYRRSDKEERCLRPHRHRHSQNDPEGLAETSTSSNSFPQVKTATQEQLKTVTFFPTPIMPTYILGFWIGDFSSVSTQAFETESDRNATLFCCGTPVPPMPQRSFGEEAVAINVHVLEGASESDAHFALDFSRRAFELFSRLFSVRFPLPKLDILGLPSMHGLGMENFGAITLLEDYMLVTPDTTFVRRRRIARLICHEVCHQWYGDIVTPESFDELWLKEGLARFFEYVAVDALDPTYRVWTNFMSEVFFQAMLADAQRKSHPVVQQHNGDIASILDSFDTITYCKGASVLRMLCYFVGPARFLEGTRRFVVDHQFASATQEDLWRAVQSVCDRDSVAINVLDLMRPWLTCERFPVLRVRMTGEDELTLSQRPFSFHDFPGETSPSMQQPTGDGTGRPAQGGERGTLDDSFESGAGGNDARVKSKPGLDAPPDASRVWRSSSAVRWVIPLRVRVGDGSRPKSACSRGDSSSMDAREGFDEAATNRCGQEDRRHPGEETVSFMMSKESMSLKLRKLSAKDTQKSVGSGSTAPPSSPGSHPLESGSEKGSWGEAEGQDIGESEDEPHDAARGSPYIIMNDSHTGFFTVQYDCEQSWALALAALEGGYMSDCEAMGFVHDLILGLHEGVLVDREGGASGHSRGHGQYCDVPRLFARLQDVVRLLSRDRSHPAWCPGQLFVWELLLVCASNALVEIDEMAARQRGDAGRIPMSGVPSGAADDGDSSRAPLAGGFVMGEPLADIHPRSSERQTESVRSRLSASGKDTRERSEEAALGGDSPNSTAAALHGGNGRRVAERAARVRLFRIATDVELAVREVDDHALWHAERVGLGSEQAAEPWQSLVAMRSRMTRMLHKCQARLCLGGGFGGWAAAASVGGDRAGIVTSPVSMSR